MHNSLAPVPVSLTVSAMLMAFPAFGADTAPAPAPTPATQPAPASKAEDKKDDKKAPKQGQLEDVTVEGARPKELSSPKQPQPVKDTPQTVTVVPQEVMQQQGASNLAQILRNSPGISMQAGEGGAPNGDNMAIRGFNARTDMFINGVRDVGGYARDPFNLEQVEIFKGPSSSSSGRGSTGGSINLVTKAPQADTFYRGSVGVGTDHYQRLTLDVNQALHANERGETDTALRLNGMMHDADTPGRDEVFQGRKGVAPSLTFGLDSPTRVTLEFFHLEEHNMPDYGLPWVPAANGDGTPPTLDGQGDKIAPVDYSNFYGLVARDFEDVVTDVAAVNLVHDFSDRATLSNRLQYGRTTRDSVVTAPRFVGADSDQIRRTDEKFRDETNAVLSNQTNLLLKFETGRLKHTLTTGVEVALEWWKDRDQVQTPDAAPGVPDTDLWNPNPHDPYAATISHDGNYRKASSTSLAAYLFDTVELSEQWAVTGGLRFDRNDFDFHDTNGGVGGVPLDLGRTDDMLSWRAGVVFTPVKNGNIYASAGTSFNPSAEGQTLTAATAAVEPEESTSYEVGTKWNFFHERLLLSAAAFRTEKTNARTVVAGETTLDGEQRVKGFELGVTGRITPEWSVIGGYTYMDSEVLASGVATDIGRDLANTPRHAASLWTVYSFPGGLDLGLGASYIGERYASGGGLITNLRQADAYLVFDAMAAYRVNSHFTLRLNVYNLANERYLDALGGGHAIPAPGRSAVLTAEFAF